MSFDLQWPEGLTAEPKGLNAGILHLCDMAQSHKKPPAPHYCQDDVMRTNKLWILNLAYQPWRTDRPRASLDGLERPNAFGYSSKHDKDAYPDYFTKQSFPASPSQRISRKVAKWPYSYEDAKKTVSFWVDFADTFLGGGTFGNGFLQEENMAYQIPELANAAGLRWVEQIGRYTLYTRDKKDFPTPFALCGAWHTVKIDIRGDQIRSTPTTDLGNYVKAVDPHQVNVLAMATPRVEDLKVEHQKALPVVCDLFNTFVAGFTLAHEQAKPSGSPVRINSGPIGTGDFNNNIHLVYILQVLAASFAAASLGLDPAPELVLYGYADNTGQSNKVANDSEELLQQIDNEFKDLTKTITVLESIPSLNIPPNP